MTTSLMRYTNFAEQVDAVVNQILKRDDVVIGFLTPTERLNKAVVILVRDGISPDRYEYRVIQKALRHLQDYGMIRDSDPPFEI